ncbi:hypothetical protein EYF80_044610 [Liparis tanakae]|uniref:Uncharacterized protein n=1 Tax=Liparis tanakae TaxID=230148 RepID=A0A4Z2FWB4_9TELE|nr:hypothetical protein EYF80_044610 [Liparis tanakae]
MALEENEAKTQQNTCGTSSEGLSSLGFGSTRSRTDVTSRLIQACSWPRCQRQADLPGRGAVLMDARGQCSPTRYLTHTAGYSSAGCRNVMCKGASLLSGGVFLVSL